MEYPGYGWSSFEPLVAFAQKSDKLTRLFYFYMHIRDLRPCQFEAADIIHCITAIIESRSGLGQRLSNLVVLIIVDSIRIYVSGTSMSNGYFIYYVVPSFNKSAHGSLSCNCNTSIYKICWLSTGLFSLLIRDFQLYLLLGSIYVSKTLNLGR